MPTYVKLCEKTLRKNAGLEVVLLNEEKAWELIGARPPHYDALKHWAHKADIIRWSLIYKYGGMWLDTDTILINPVDGLYDEAVDKDRLLLLRYTQDLLPTMHSAITNNVIVSPAKHPLVQDILKDQIDTLFTTKGINTVPDKSWDGWFVLITSMQNNLLHTEHKFRLIDGRMFAHCPFDERPIWCEYPGIEFFKRVNPKDIGKVPDYARPGSYGYQIINTLHNFYDIADWPKEKLLHSKEFLVSYIFRDVLGVKDEGDRAWT